MSDRDPQTGRFIPGNKAGTGNPSGRRGRPKTYYTEYIDELHDTLTLEAWGRIIDKAIEQALSGDHRARQFLASYAIGQPIQMIAADINGERERSSIVLDAIRDSLPLVEDEES